MSYCNNCGNKNIGDALFCGKCGTEISNLKETKKSKIIGNAKNNRKYLNLTLVTAFIAFIIYYFMGIQTPAEKLISNQPEISEKVGYSMNEVMTTINPTVKNGKIILDLDTVVKNKFVKFYYTGNKVSIPLLAYINDDGKLITAISMCEPCNSTDFHINGSELVCNSCGTTWDRSSLETISGSCGKYPPDPIESNVVGNQIQISEIAVTNWQRRI